MDGGPDGGSQRNHPCHRGAGKTLPDLLVSPLRLRSALRPFPEDAQDLTQAFFARLLEGQWIGRADREKGKFRSFLLSALKCFLSDEWDRARAKKRGGGLAPLPLQFDTAETRYGQEPADHTTPEQLYERRWALALLEEVLRRLAQEYAQDGKANYFAELNPCLVGDRAALPYAELAAKLGVSESAVKSIAHRMRLRYRELLREEIANTVNNPAEVDEELRRICLRFWAADEDFLQPRDTVA